MRFEGFPRGMKGFDRPTAPQVARRPLQLDGQKPQDFADQVDPLVCMASFVAPEADLFANPGGTGLIGVHYAGPTWESVSGSKVVGLVEQRCIADSDDIPWLLLSAVSSEGPGPFGHVTYIQRVNTSGGIAPTQAGNNPGDLARVPYTTEYYFYRDHP